MPQPEIECHDIATGAWYSSQSKVIAIHVTGIEDMGLSFNFGFVLFSLHLPQYKASQFNVHNYQVKEIFLGYLFLSQMGGRNGKTEVRY